MDKNRTILLLMMGGNGTRFGRDIPKQFYMINDHPIFIYILKKLNKIDCIDDIIILTNPKYLEYTEELVRNNNVNKVYKILPGGNGRSQDILAGLDVASEFAKDDDVVLMFDATHPFVDVEGVEKVVNAIKETGAATLAEFQYDTTYLMNEETNEIEQVIPRKKVIAGASPEGFKFKLIYDIYKNTPKENLNDLTSAGAIALQNNIKMIAVETTEINLKITYQSDMKLVEKVSTAYFDKND